jgi:hypothetical protein
MAAAARDAHHQGAQLERRVTVPDGTSVTVEHGAGAAARAWGWLVSRVVVAELFAKKVWRIGADDPRKVVHGLKVGLALVLVSVFFYTRTLYDGVGGNAIWAVITVVVVFEFTVGKSQCYQTFLSRKKKIPSMTFLCMGRWLRVQMCQQSRRDGVRRFPSAWRKLGGGQMRRARAGHPQRLPLPAGYVLVAVAPLTLIFLNYGIL